MGLEQPEGGMKRGTPLTCEQCGANFEARNRNGVRKRFCSVACKDRLRNAQRLKGAALLNAKLRPVTRRRVMPGKRLIDLAVIPIAERPALLAEAASRLGVTAEGPALRAARLAARAGAET